MITPEELIQDLIDFYGYEVDLSYETELNCSASFTLFITNHELNLP